MDTDGTGLLANRQSWAKAATGKLKLTKRPQGHGAGWGACPRDGVRVVRVVRVF